MRTFLSMLFRSRDALMLGALLSACGSGTPAQSQSQSQSSDAILHDTRPPLHHARHTSSGYVNNYGDLPHESFLKWRWERWTQGLPKPPANGYEFPLDRPDVAWLKANRIVDTLTWIGHASALVQIDGVNVLTDPQFSRRASPVSFAGPERKVPAALSVAELPHIDVVLISHNHYDHLDTASVQALNAQPGGPPLFLVPLGIKAWMADKGIANVREMDWGDETRAAGLAVWFVPSQHWSARTLTDRAETLWGGWVVKTPEGAKHPYSFCFVGDTGYSKDFADIGQAFGGFDLALIPIGAYAPRWFMHAQHVDPKEAVQVFGDLRAKKAIGVHWGTFELADDPLDEAPRLLADAVKEAGLAPDSFTVLRHGQTIRLGDTR
ncbi:Zn-dependent hydrolase of the beta-lactamase fold-like protein [Caballeronia terrestris]|uniref:Zn-dependent hydrolase of the beta-lactamase fold-like protein n=1 Tax=Caballeronia terrestris TaxID=1226301 RepID=A0A158F1E0_9BURK|nr:MBL fold metallo-hydrolase [Caballeronia terrestris]SAL13602.1 Zn-dependent hydrolase of the beta-lactamase fold-like protein [Caballeronia terrestris]